MRSALALLVAILLVPSASAAPFLQAGYDAARTGATPDPGPASDDVAFTRQLAARPAPAAPPLILDGHAYVLTRTGIDQVDLATADSRILVDLSHTVRQDPLVGEVSGVSGFASDGKLLFVGRMGGADAYTLDGSGPVWSWEHPRSFGSAPFVTNCDAPAVRAGAVFLVCSEETLEIGTASALSAGGIIHAARLDAATGQTAWTWSYVAHTSPAPTAPGLPNVDFYPGSPLPAAWFWGPVVIGPVVVVMVEQIVDPRGTLEDHFIALDADTGEVVWSRRFGDPAASTEDELVQSYGATIGEPVAPTGDDARAFLRLRTLAAVDPATGLDAWTARVGSGATTSTGNGDLALSGGTLYLAAGSLLHRFDAETGAPRWTAALSGTDTWHHHEVVVANATLFGRASDYLYAFDVGDGTLRWRHGSVAGTEDPIAIGEGVLAYLSDETLTILGRTPASLGPRVDVSATYPAPGASVSANLSSSSPGVFGPPTEFRVDWGDGTVDDWQASPRFNHTYGSPGERTARFFVRNEAGQTASVTRTIHVGGTPPRELNLMQKAFDRKNQDLTFGMLGIALALGGGIFAVTRSRTRRRRVQRELDAIERAYADTRERPLECEAALAERRAHVRGLGLDGKLDQSEVLLLERRIDELAQGSRLDSIDAQFPFLPVSMARTLRDMLADGRIVAWERKHFVRALDEDAHMTKAQKKRVREQVDAWFARDEGGAA